MNELKYGDWVRYDGLDWQYIETTDCGDIILRDVVGHGNHSDKWPGSDVCQVIGGFGVVKISSRDNPDLFLGANI